MQSLKKIHAWAQMKVSLYISHTNKGNTPRHYVEELQNTDTHIAK